MGCNFSSEPVRVVDYQGTDTTDKLEISDINKRPSVTKSHESFISNGSIESDKLTIHSGSDILAPHRSKSIDLSRNGSANRDGPPVATATIIRGPPTNYHSPSKSNKLEVPLPHQTEEITPSSAQDITRRHPSNGPSNLNQRRSSEGDVGKVTSVTCIPRSLIKANPLLSSNMPENKIKKPMLFGPRNSRLTLTESQKDFFRMLDEKVAQGKDYCSEDERSLASFRSFNAHRKDSNDSNGIITSTMPHEVR